ncbi:MarR family transcriptional regulator [Actinomadura darangshiensis]|uniref:MarR family transcriptional regulator n=1 Tax=Actinomadura darangshiensis TaxID=705336 RepID=A0A4R5C4S7_9ACTN|nr:MarR family transcriptional regulator [Actinomadura darangshiensis]TDD92980.1 MarR family transcriptional regulator [Actinomadura darangshiensis]
MTATGGNDDVGHGASRGTDEDAARREEPPASDAGYPDLPTTAYLVLGVLVVTDESLTAGEIKVRSQHTVGHFYWAPAVSHIRRELARLIEHGMAAERTIHVGKRKMTVYESTARGERRLRAWAEALPGDEPVMTKHPLMLKIWLAGDTEPASILDAVDRYLETVQKSIDELMWAQSRGRELGLLDEPMSNYPQAVTAYTLRSLHAEMSNIRQLRDDIAWNLGDAYQQYADHPKTSLRPRARPEE